MICRKIILLCICIILKDASCLKLIALKVPAHVETGKPVVLECLYELEGDALYSVKWYKDNHEFYRYLPANNPPSQIFNLTGVAVDLKNSTNKSVRLDNVSLASAGMYKCEVSTETPFHTEENEQPMNVYDIPDGGPRISGGRSKYNVGDTVRVNCTAVRSKPAAYLEWHVNGDKATKDILHKYPVIVDDDDLETSILGLEFKVEGQHFTDGELTLKCTASINYIYQESYEQAISADHLQASLLESQQQPRPVKVNNGGLALTSKNIALWLVATLVHSVSAFHR